MDDETWNQMMASLQMDLYPKAQAKLDHDLVNAYRGTFWEIYKWTGADPMDYESCPLYGVLIPDIPILAFNEVKDLRNRYDELQASADRLEQFAMWLASMDDSNPDQMSEERRIVTLTRIIERAKGALGVGGDD